jgi:hypothetical protein
VRILPCKPRSQRRLARTRFPREKEEAAAGFGELLLDQLSEPRALDEANVVDV